MTWGSFRDRLFASIEGIRGSILPPPVLVELPEAAEVAEGPEIVPGGTCRRIALYDIHDNLIYLDGGTPVLAGVKVNEEERIRGMMEIRDVTRASH